MAADFIVETPRGRIIEVRHANGSVTAELKWNPGMGDEYAGRFRRAQRFMDSECLRLMDPYVPMRTGALVKSGTLGTVIGSGKIQYIVPYARRQYYENKGGSPGHPKGGRLWCERMKVDHMETLRREVGKIVAGGK